MDLEKYAKQALAGRDAGALEALARSEGGRRLADGVDGAALERAFQAGDTQTLARTLRQILSTPEGRAFAESVKKAADGHGR